MFTTLVLILILLAAFSLVWWGVSRMAVPEPIKTIVLVIMGLVALVFIYQMVLGGWHAPSLR
jgi:hypothetical protein